MFFDQNVTCTFADSDYEVRIQAVRRLGDVLTGSKCPPELIRLLTDPEELVRIEVCESLGAIGDRKALPALWRATNDRSPLVRSYAAGAIGELGDQRDVAKLKKWLVKVRSETVRIGIYQALYRLNEHDVLDKVIRLLSKSRDYRVRCAAASTLSNVIANKTNAATILSVLRSALEQNRRSRRRARSKQVSSD